MAADLERLAREFGEKGFGNIAASLNTQAVEARRQGAPEHFPVDSREALVEILDLSIPRFSEITPDLGSEWARQADELACLFANLLGKSRQEYIDGLPQFNPQPESYKGRFDIPVIVQTPTLKLTLARMLEVTGIVSYFSNPGKIKDWHDPGKFCTPEPPYTTWLDDGSRNLGHSVRVVRNTLAVDERGGTIFDGITLYLNDPRLLERHNLDLPGSQFGVDYAPDLHFWRGRPGLGGSFVDSAHPRFGSVVAGRSIVTK